MVTVARERAATIFAGVTTETSQAADAAPSAKAAALQEFEAEVFVGDHLGDITGARAADALAVGVATGPISAEDLQAAGADVVLPDLTRFPEWLESYLLATVH